MSTARFWLQSQKTPGGGDLGEAHLSVRGSPSLKRPVLFGKKCQRKAKGTRHDTHKEQNKNTCTQNKNRTSTKRETASCKANHTSAEPQAGKTPNRPNRGEELIQLSEERFDRLGCQAHCGSWNFDKATFCDAKGRLLS